MDRCWLGVGAGAGFLAVIAGTFAAHGLDQRLTPEMLEVFETGVRYHMYHALAIVLSAVIRDKVTGGLPTVAAAAFLVGILFFSGSLYLLAVTEARWLGMVAPVGGVSFLVGWGVLVVAAVKSYRG